MTYRGYVAAAAGGSALLLLGALAFQFLGGIAPCKMCYWQRYPHVAAVVIGLIALALPSRLLAWLGAAAAAATAVIGVYHAGVEMKLWQGPTSCTGNGSLGGLSGSDLLSTDGPLDIVMCDVVAWSLAGISMAGWNAILSFGLAAIWVMAATRRV
ncbi:disulfide bond formation protein B [Oceanicola sp. 22II-s10i]|uniref:disulfide bond formation protein B n=1 Tax=Oceanicola sp. 22II-s10i TaxID=1317116 RepID=UPI000B521918|nr:disulfide bond formation protein B [Oceanicola sp. 22II-s10i]